MEKTNLIKKWLNYDLNSEEFETFKDFDDYNDLIKISENLKKFKVAELNKEEILSTILSKKEQQESIDYIKLFSRIVAVFLICFSAYYLFFSNTEVIVSSGYANKINTELPDKSTVQLNAVSSVSFNEKQWDKKRNVTLKGEALFKVTKGSAFNVITSKGIVSVLGTEFNVKSRNENLEVICYKGSVSVTYQSKTEKLHPGDEFKSGILIKKQTSSTSPCWTRNESEFKSTPFIEVLQEFERQYNVKITIKNIDSEQLFTGKFNHDDINLALKAIALPLNISYSKNENEIILKSECSL